MKKFLMLGLSAAALLAFSLSEGKSYTCKTNGVAFNDGNQTRNIPLTPKTEPLLKKTLKNFFEINVKKINKDTVNIKVGGDEENLTFAGKWNGYNKYQDKAGAVIFMPDKNASSNNAALIIPPQRVVIFYQCQ